jgi:superfamily II DNA/RNA helicase
MFWHNVKAAIRRKCSEAAYWSLTNISIDSVAGLDAGSNNETSPGPAGPNPSNEVRFEDLGLSPQLLKAVADSGYTTPTPIQARGIPLVLQGKDLIGIAQTGTGKTASFTLPMIEILARGRAKARMPRTLILEPTRELAAQVAESFERYGKYHKLTMALLIGGVSFDDQDKKLDRGVDVLIATPGRLLDHFGRGKLMLTGVQVLVIDEADRMLDMGFIPDVERIAKLTPFTRQTLFYSATMPPEIQRLTDQFLQAPVRVEVSRPATAATTIKQIAVTVPGGEWSKRESLRRLIREHDVKNAIVFCNRKRDVDVLAKSLQKHSFSVAPLHGDLDQSVRTRTLDAFRAGEIAILVASDVAARGLDIPAVSHIFNFDVPFQPDDYIHRIGRTGRAGRIGYAFMLVGPREEKSVAAIEKLTGLPIERQVMEGLPEETPRPERTRESRGTRGPGRQRGESQGRQRHGRTGHAPRHESVSPAPAEERVVVPPAARPEPAPRAVQRPQPPKSPEARVPEPRPAGHDASQLPAFLLRPIRLPPKPTKRLAVADNEG